MPKSLSRNILSFAPDAARRRVLGGAGLALAAAFLPAALASARAPARTKPTGTSGIAKAAAVPAGWVDVRGYGALGNGEADDSAAFQRALREGGKVYVPAGRYVVGNLLLQAGNALLGEGRESQLLQAPSAYYAASVNPRSLAPRDVALNARGIFLSKVHFVGRSATDGFAEHYHLLNVNGCSGMIVDQCLFTGFRGDGIYLGSGNTPGHIAHNERITVRHCEFDGVNGQNRNGISVIDGDGIVIEDCTFRRCSRPDMPGAIDLEPDENPEHVLRDVTVRRNRITECTGGVGAISLILPIKEFGTAPTGFLFEDNEIDGNGVGQGITLKRYAPTDAATPPMRIVIRRNKVRNTKQVLLISGMKDVLVQDNAFEDSATEAVLSHPNHGPVHGVRFEGNAFTRIGARTGIALKLNASRGITLQANRFTQAAGPAESVAVEASAVPVAEITWSGNEFTAEAGKPSYALSLRDTPEARAWANALPPERKVNTERVKWIGTLFPERSRRRQQQS